MVSKLDPLSEIASRPHGILPDGSSVVLCILRSAFLEASISTYGARIVDLRMRGEDGAWNSVILGFASLQEYVDDRAYLGATVGRYANRIAYGRFTLDSHEYRLSQNDGVNSLHGGQHGFDQQVWTPHLHAQSVTMEYTSAKGEEGYPGSLTAVVRYSVVGNELRLTYEACSTHDTPVNLTNHMYFNLGENPHEEVLHHVVTLRSSHFTPVDAGLIPTGELRAVDGTPFDFRGPRSIGERIDVEDPQLKLAGGYDHNWVLSKPFGSVELAAQVYEPRSRRVLDVLTSEPGLQFYTGNQLPAVTGADRRGYEFRCGFCLETQHFPDSPNQPNFPSTILKAGDIYRSQTIYRLRTEMR